MAALFSSGRIVIAIVLLMAIECVLLLSLRKKTRHGLSAGVLLSNTASGACLLMALRAALLATPWYAIAAWLLLALLAHLVDLRLRWADGRAGRKITL